MSEQFNRREFTRTTLAAAAVSACRARRAPARTGANDRVRIGCIGVGNRGVQDLQAFRVHPDAQIVALSDVYEPYLKGEYDKVDPRFKALKERIPRRQPDFGRAG